MSVLCILGVIFQLIILVTLSGTLVAFAAFSNLLVFTITVVVPIFLMLIRNLSKFLYYSLSLLLLRTRSVLHEIDYCVWIPRAEDLNQRTMDESLPSATIDPTIDAT